MDCEVSPTPPLRLVLWAVAALGLVLSLAVIWSVEYLPQLDTPNHLARHYLEYLALRGEPLPPGYAIQFRILPNLGGDLVIPVLMLAWEPLTAIKVFQSVAVILFWLGPAVFIWQVGEYRLPSLVASLLLLPYVINGFFFLGFLNYYSGIGLAFLVLAHLDRLSRQERPSLAGLVLHAGLVALLFFWHLAAVFIYGAVAGCLILARTWPRLREKPWHGLGRAVLFGWPLLPAVALFGIYSLANADLPRPPSDWGEPLHKLRMGVFFVRGYSIPADLVSGGLWLAAIGAFFGTALRALPRHWIGLATVVLALSYVVLPLQWGWTYFADSRLLPALFVCGLAWLGTLPLRGVVLGSVLLAAGLLVRLGSIGSAWQGLDARLQEAARSFTVMQPESRVLPAVLVPDAGKDHPEWHFISQAVMDRRAFVPTMFAFRDQQPLRLTAYADPPGTLPRDGWLLEDERQRGPTFGNGGRIMVRDGVLDLTHDPATAHYDYLWVYNPERVALALPAHWTKLFTGDAISVWRIASPTAAGNQPG